MSGRDRDSPEASWQQKWQDKIRREVQVLEQKDITDEQSREACVTILGAVNDYLQRRCLPKESVHLFLRETVSRVVQELGPGDSLFRETWCSILRRSAHLPDAGLEYVLEFLPSAILPDDKDKDIALEVLGIFKQLVQKNSSSLPLVVQCLRRLAATGRIPKKDAFEFVIEQMSQVPKDSVESVVTCLIENITTTATSEETTTSDDEDLSSLAVDAIRNEFQFLQGNNDTLKLPFRSLVQTFQRFVEEEKYTSFLEEYLATLEDECSSSTPTISREECRLGPLDIMILLMHREHSDHGPLVLHLLDDAILHGAIQKQQLLSLIGVNEGLDVSAIVHGHLVWFLIFLCLGPARSPKMATLEVAELAKEFGVELVTSCGAQERRQLVSSLVQIIEECLFTMNEARNKPSQASESGKASSDTIVLRQVLSNVMRILVVIAERHPNFLDPHKAVFARSLCANSDAIDSETVQSLCRVLVLIYKHGLSQTAIDDGFDEDPFFVTRELLFSSGETARDKQDDRAVDKCVRGLLLASELVSIGQEQPELVSLLWQTIRTVLLPPTSRLAHPRVASQGLWTIRSFHTWSANNDNSAENNLTPGIFPTLTSILMASRVVQYSGNNDNASRNKATGLAYAIRPQCFKNEGSKKRKYHKMVFSFDALHLDPNFSSPSQWEVCSRWLFLLIDSYLSLGRQRSKGKWIPHAWVEAALEFPLKDLSMLRATNVKQQRVVDLMKWALNDFDASTVSSVWSKGSHDKEFGEVLKLVKSRSTRAEIVEGLLRSSMSYCLGLAISAAVLSNTYAHFAYVLDDWAGDGNRQERVEATRLMQFQLAKIYDLVAKCRVMGTAFRRISSGDSRGRGRPKKGNRGVKGVGLLLEKMELHEDIDVAPQQLKTIHSIFLSTDEYVKSEVLWHCLVDPSHDTYLISSIEKLSQQTEGDVVDTSYDTIIELRLNILEHLNGHLQRFSGRCRTVPPTSLPHSLVRELARIQPFFAQCLRLAAFLSSKVTRLEESCFDTKRRKQISTLTAAYFRLLLLTMELSLDRKPDADGGEGKLLSLVEFLGLYRCIMGAERPLTDAIVADEQNTISIASSLKLTMNSILRHLTRCTDLAIAMELVEMLSILALRSKVDDAVAEMVHTSWTALHSIFSCVESASTAHVSFAFTEALRSLCPRVLQESSWRTKSDTAVRETVVKLAFSKTKVLEKHSFLVQSMLRHWGFLALAERASPSSADHLHQLYTNLHNFLSTVDETSLPRHRVSKIEDHSDDGEYLPPKYTTTPKPALPEPSVACIDSKNFCAYFHVLLDMTVASCALFTVNDGGDWTDPLNGPYRELCKMVETFGSLVTLYRKRIHVFPQTALPPVLNACRSMLNAVSYQSTQCTEWRSSQPTLAVGQIGTAAFDPASVVFVSRLFDAFGLHVIGTLEILCTSIETLSNSSLDAYDSALFGPAQKQKVKALRLKSNNTYTELEKLADAHKLPPPRQSLEDADDEPERKRRRIEVKGFLQFEESAEESEDSNVFRAASGQQPSSAAPRDEAKTLSSDLTWDGDEDSSDGSFGVDGNWCRESDEET